MKKRTIFIGGVILLVALMLILVLSSRHTNPPRTFGFGVTMTHKRGHLGRVFSDDLSIAFVTNQTPSAITLSGQVVQRKKPDGGIVSDMGSIWNGEVDTISLPSKGVAQLPFDFPKDAQAVRVTYEYEGGDSLHGHYESPWMPNTALEPTPTAP